MRHICVRDKRVDCAMGIVVLFGTSIIAAAQCGLPGTPACGGGGSSKPAVVRRSVPPKPRPAPAPAKVYRRKPVDEDTVPAAEVRTKAPGRAQAARLHHQGVSQVEQGELEKGIGLFTQAIEADPSLVEAYWYRGDARKQRSDYDGAIEDFKKVVEINPNY